MNVVALYSFPARMESLADMLALVKAVSFDAESAAALRAETALEELLSNSIVHGAAGPVSQACIWFGVQRNGEGLVLRYEDGFAAFDPLPKIDEALQRTSNPMDQQPLGGLGLLMVYRLADEFRYARENGRNCMHLTFVRRRLSSVARPVSTR